MIIWAVQFNWVILFIPRTCSQSEYRKAAVYLTVKPHLPIVLRAHVAVIFLATVFSVAWYKIAMQHFPVVYHGRFSFDKKFRFEFPKIFSNEWTVQHFLEFHSPWLTRFDRKMSFHFPRIYALVSDRFWHNEKHPMTLNWNHSMSSNWKS